MTFRHTLLPSAFLVAFALGACDNADATQSEADVTTSTSAAAPMAAPDFGTPQPVSVAGDAQTQISAFAAANGLEGVQFNNAGVSYLIVDPGTGQHPTVNDAVTIHYKGYLVDGKVFDQTTGEPRTFNLNQLIKAWQVAIPQIGRGGHIKIFAPPAAAYGQNPPPGSGITPESVLVFDVALVDF